MIDKRRDDKLRLTNFEIQSIKQTFLDVFEEGEIYLFGSRVDDSLKGGDIDLYIKVKDKQGLLNKKIQFLAKVKEKIGDQKIDVVVSKDETKIIEKEAIAKGVKL